MNESISTGRDVVEKLADEFLAGYRAGKCTSIDEFVSRYPELADELGGLLQAMIMLEQNVPPVAGATPAPRGMAASDERPRQIDDFRIVRELGRGGMGVVYEAVQQSLGRQVALKVLSFPGLLNPAHLERFRREARAAARLQHSNIVPVFGFGVHNGTYYYAMQYVAGPSLDLVIQSVRHSRSTSNAARHVPTTSASSEADAASGEQSGSTTSSASDTYASAWCETELSSSADRRQFYHHVARIGLQAAEALAYAHSAGVLHRDVKPSNLLLDAKGNIWITDFGLARTEGDDDLTHTGDFVGTLRYTAPERLEGWSDRRSDIYSLGVTLYELLTLEAFFCHRSRAELVRSIADDSPVAPRRIDASIPVDLETIVLKAVAKDPAARYHRAEQMAEDLRRFLADRPILARRSTAAERFARWCRRNPAIALLSGTVVAVLVTAVVLLTLNNAQIRRESAAKIAAWKDREAALEDKDRAVGQVWMYRGLYGMDGEQAEVLRSFDKALALTPDQPETLWFRGFTLGSWGRWDEAIADMTKARPLLPKSNENSLAMCDWFIAMAHIADGDRAAYQAACRAALDRLPTEPSLEERGKLLWMCTVAPYALDDPSRLADFTSVVLPPGNDTPTSDQLLEVGAALYRAGKLPAARRRLEQALDQIAAGKPTSDPMSEIFAHLFLAMTDAGLGSTQQAQPSLGAADRLAEVIKPSCWVDELQLKVLTDEARAVLGE